MFICVFVFARQTLGNIDFEVLVNVQDTLLRKAKVDLRRVGRAVRLEDILEDGDGEWAASSPFSSDTCTAANSQQAFCKFYSRVLQLADMLDDVDLAGLELSPEIAGLFQLHLDHHHHQDNDCLPYQNQLHRRG